MSGVLTDAPISRTPGRIAFAGDWHANGPWAQMAIKYAVRERHADVIVHLGDFGYEFEPSFLDRVDRTLGEVGVSLFFVDGNHEAFPTLYGFPVRPGGLRQVAERVWHLPRGFRWSWGGVRFLALGGAYSIDRRWRVRGESWWPEEVLTAEEVATASLSGEVDVLVAHDCPAGVDIPGLIETKQFWPGDDLALAGAHRSLVRQVTDATRPAAIWHGHYHRRYSAMADIGYGPVRVEGLDCDGTRLEKNVVVVDLSRAGKAVETSSQRSPR